MFKKSLLVLSVLFSASFAQAQTTVKLLTEDNDSYPYNMKNKTGMDFILLEMVGKKLNVKFNVDLVPWERCLETMKSGDADGCFPASFKEARMEQGVYPMKDAKGDSAQRIHNSSYSLFVPAADVAKYTVNGMELGGVEKGKTVICVTKGYSIADDLSKAGYKVDADSTDSLALYRKLMAKRCDVIVGLSEEGDANIAAAEFKGKVAKVSPALVEKAYYLMLSKKFVAANGDLAKKIWATAGEVRESAEYKAAINAFLSKK